jgi:hypothetical protein
MNAKNGPEPPRRRARVSSPLALETRFAFRAGVSPQQSEKVETEEAKKERVNAERVAEERGIAELGPRLRALGFSPGGTLRLLVEAEEQLWQVLRRQRCGLDTVLVTDLEAALREDLKVSFAPSVAWHIRNLRLLLEQGGIHGPCPPGWTAERWRRKSDPATIADELGRLADAIALRPLKSGRGGRPRTPPALTKRWGGFSKLKSELASLLEEAFWLAKKERVIVPGSTPRLGRLIEWVSASPVLRDRVDSIPDFGSSVPWPWDFMLAKRLEELARHGYPAQRIPLFAAHWATELRTGHIGSPLSETKGHRLKRGK